ncbi:MAG TPA: ribonuclease HII [Actinomycetota bacterium]
MEPDGRFEQRLREAGFSLVAGVDEAGRGALAGPLVAAAVILPEGCSIEGLTDSKLLTAAVRARLAVEIKARAVAISVVRVPNDSIDRRGLHRSNLRALREAAMRLRPMPEYLLIDGYPIAPPPFPSLSIKKGDLVSTAVAAASIIAKTTRDRMMRNLARRHPEYGFKQNKGYATPEHWRALRTHGPCAVHRLSFAGVGQGSLFDLDDVINMTQQIEEGAAV